MVTDESLRGHMAKGCRSTITDRQSMAKEPRTIRRKM